MPTASSSPEEEPGLAVERALRSRRRALNLSQRELGKRAKVSAAYVSAFEAGRLVPSLSVFARLAVELRLSPMEIVVLVWNESFRDRTASTVTGDADNGINRSETRTTS